MWAMLCTLVCGNIREGVASSEEHRHAKHAEHFWQQIDKHNQPCSMSRFCTIWVRHHDELKTIPVHQRLYLSKTL